MSYVYLLRPYHGENYGLEVNVFTPSIYSEANFPIDSLPGFAGNTSQFSKILTFSVEGDVHRSLDPL